MIRPPIGLVPGFITKALSYPFHLGTIKYAVGDWASRTTPEAIEEFILQRRDSLGRHYSDYMDGIFYDEDGLPNLVTVAWNALILFFYHGRLQPDIVHYYHPTLYPAAIEKRRQEKEAANAERTETDPDNGLSPILGEDASSEVAQEQESSVLSGEPVQSPTSSDEGTQVSTSRRRSRRST